MTSDEIRAMFARREIAWALRDSASLAADNAEDCVLESPTAGTVVGRSAIEKVYQDYFLAFPDLTFITEDLLPIGDRVVQTATVSGTDTGGFLGQVPTGKPFRVTVVLILTLKGDRIVHERRVLDRGGLLLQLGAEAGLATESARLYRATLERTRLEHELTVAAGIQQALLPPSTYAGNGLELSATSVPCRAIGGDFFDYFELLPGRFGIAVGDVAGKGPPAALLTAVLQGILAAHVYRGETPAVTIKRVNESLVRRAVESRFATMLYAVVSIDGRLTYCNAGHNAPILIGRRKLLRLETGGPIIGAFSDAIFDEETLQLDSGDTLVAFSDGVSEAFNPSQDEFGDERLLSCVQSNLALPPSSLVKSLLAAMEEFVAGAPQNDDVTVLILRYFGAQSA
jgi:serine phosphatase RsbU (regulator of sigma subunit)